MSIDKALELVYTMEDYSAECFDLLQEEIAEIKKLEDQDSVKNYKKKDKPGKKYYKTY